jgi:hypothetical protein
MKQLASRVSSSGKGCRTQSGTGSFDAEVMHD